MTRVDHEHAERLAREACTMGTPGGFVMESSSKMDDLGVPPWIGNLHNMYVDYVDIYICMCKYIYIGIHDT